MIDELAQNKTLEETPAKRAHQRGRTGLIALAALLLLGSALGTQAAHASVVTGANPAEKRPVSAAPVEATKDQSFIVVYRDEVSLSSRLRAEAELGVKPRKVFRNVFKGFVARLDQESLARLEADPRVRLVEPDGKVTIQANAPQDRSTPSWGLDRIDQRGLPLNSRLVTGNNGFGVETYVIDTGVRLDHTQFSGRMSPEGFSAFGSSWNDCNGHGTHVAGTVAGATYGVAPAARVTAVRVLDCAGFGTDSSVIAGIDWMIGDHKAGEPAVGNMSLGGDRTEALNAAVERAVADGITMAVAAGNESSDACFASPASAPSALTIGSTTRTDEMSSFSNVGSCVDLFAPGSQIVSASYASPNAVETLSGTSMASPHVAGAAALLLSAQPSLSPAAVSESLIASSTPGAVSALRGCTLNRLLYVGSGPDLPGPVAPDRPPLDDFADAQNLTSLNGTDGTSTCATKEAGEPSHGPDSNASIWYRWTAPSSGTLVLNTNGSSFDTVLAVYTGSSVASLIRLAQDDDSGDGVASRVSLPVTAGTTYSIAIDGYGRRSGSTRIAGSFSGGGGDPGEPGAPPNDAFANSQSLTPSVQTSGSNVGATAEPGEPGHAQSQPRASIWYRWTATSSGTLTLNTNGSSFDTVLAVYTGSSVGSLTRRAQDDDSGAGTASQLSLGVTAGTFYSIAIDGYSGATGTTRIVGSLSGGGEDPGDPTNPNRPVNDDFAAATRINNWQSSINTSNEGATVEVDEPPHYDYDETAHGSIWYRWVAPSNGVLQIDTSSTWGLPIAAYTGSSLASLDRVGSGWRDLVLRVREGTEYRIAFDQHYPDSVSDIRITGAFTAAPANDDFDDARVVTSWRSTVTTPNTSATTESGEPSHDPDDDGPFASVWYEWTPTSNGLLSLDARSSSFSHPRIALYTGSSIDSLERIASGMNDLMAQVRSGVRYRVAVDAWSIRRLGEVRLSGSFVQAPGNDDFEDASPIDLNTPKRVGTVHGSTLESGEPDHQEEGSADPTEGSIWYRWTAPQDMTVNFRASCCAVNLITAYEGSSVEALNRVASGSFDSVGFQARAGRTYSFAVSAWNDQTERVEVRLRRRLSMPTLIKKPKITTRSRKARFVFGGDPGARFECKINRQRKWKKCNRVTTFRKLRKGEQFLRVRQVHGQSRSEALWWWWEVRPQ